MTQAIQEHIKRLQRLVPLNALSPEGLERVLEALEIDSVANKTTLFRRGDDDDLTLFLLAGQVELNAGDRSQILEASSDKALYALSSLKPRQYTAQTRSEAVIARIPSALLDKVLAWDQMTHTPADQGCEVQELAAASADTDWMIRTLRTPVFLHLPAANIQAVLARFEEIEVSKGEVVIREGDPGDYFYLIKQGQCQVSRKNAASSADEVCDQMREGDAFGQDALVSARPRNASITMTSDGTLMRLARQDFNALMQEPLLNSVDAPTAAALAREGAQLLDVRMPSEFAGGSIKHSKNIALSSLRLQAGEFPPGRTYIVFCDTGARSAAAAFLLTERGLDARVLKGGLAALLSARSTAGKPGPSKHP